MSFVVFAYGTQLMVGIIDMTIFSTQIDDRPWYEPKRHLLNTHSRIFKRQRDGQYRNVRYESQERTFVQFLRGQQIIISQRRYCNVSID